MKSAFILCHYYFVVLLRVNEDWAVGMKHATVSSDVIRLVFEHRRRTKLVWNHLCMFENSNDTMLLFQCLQSFAFSNDINRVSYHSHWNCKLKPISVSIHVEQNLAVLEFRRIFKTHSFCITFVYIKKVFYKLTSDAHLKHIGKMQSAAYKVYIRA